MVIRRSADPTCVQHIWNAIKHPSALKQVVDDAKIIKYLQKNYDCTLSQAKLYLKQTLDDGLIVTAQKTGRTSSPSGSSVEVYKLPSQEEPVLDGKDWYCFECHLAGDVTPCKKCFRVFHSDCVFSGRRKYDNYAKTVCARDTGSGDGGDQGSSADVVGEGDASDGVTTTKLRKKTANGGNKQFDESLCNVCNMFQLDTHSTLTKSELNYLLKFVLHRIRAWLPSTITHTMASEDTPEWLKDSDLTWRANQLFFEHKDMSVIEVNLNNESYNTFSEFHADVLTVQHNVAIFHGLESQEYGAAELMVRDSLHDLVELMNCPDCYKHSNEKINAKWFCLPCREPHKLVWAKQKGYPYWPAKVIKETSTHFDVRFFGGKYERSLLMKNFIKPISLPKESQSLQIKPSAAFNKAYDELKFHQKLLNDPAELQKFIASSKQKRRSVISKQKSPLMPRNKRNSKQPTDSRDLQKALNSTSEYLAGPAFSSTPRQGNKRKSTGESTSTASTKRTPAPTTLPPPRPVRHSPNPSDDNPSDSVIHISDGEDDDDDGEEYSYRQAFHMNNMDSDSAYEQVSSSTENYRQDSVRSDSGMQQLDHPYSDSVEKMRRKLLGVGDKKEIIKCAMDCMQTEIDKITNDHNEQLKRLFESHNAQISETKKKQWCYNCEQDAIYHCCWNTAYCSQTCQQQHWQAEHKKVCRRKR